MRRPSTMASVVRAVRTRARGQALERDPDHRASRPSSRRGRRPRSGSARSATIAAVGQEQDAVGARGRARVVGDHDGRLAVERRRPRAAARGPRRRTSESRLPVGSSANRTVGREISARAIGDALLLAAGELARPVVAALGEADALDQRVERPRGRPCAPAIASGSRMFSSARERRQQVEGLEDEADVLAAQLGELACRSSSVMSSPPIVHGARGRAVEAGEQVHQRRLARARRAHDGGELAGGHVERDAAQRVDGGLALAVAAGDGRWRTTAAAMPTAARRWRGSSS